MGALPFGKAAIGEPIRREDGVYTKEQALWEIIHNSNEIGLRILDQDLDPRVFGRREILHELGLMLSYAGSYLEVFTSPETLKKFGDHPHHAFVEYVKEKQKTHKGVLIKGVVPPAGISADFLQGSLGQIFSVKNNGLGYLFNDRPDFYKNMSSIFDSFRTAPFAEPLVEMK